MHMSVGFVMSAFIFTATACGSSTYGPSSNPPASCAGTGASATIDATAGASASSFTFSPANPPAITAGQKVRWGNNNGLPPHGSSGAAQTTPPDDPRVTGGPMQDRTTNGLTL